MGCSHTAHDHMSNPIGILWALLSLMVAGMSNFAFVQPFWILEPRKPDCLGVYSYCVKDSSAPTSNRQLCGLYGGYFSLQNLPTRAWMATCVLFGCGCVLHGAAAIAGVVALCLRRTWDKRVASYSGIAQAVAVLLCIAGLLTFPLGFDSLFVRYYCHTSDLYKTGVCELGWGYLLAVMATALSVFCPILAQFFDLSVCERRYSDYVDPRIECLVDCPPEYTVT